MTHGLSPNPIGHPKKNGRLGGILFAVVAFNLGTVCTSVGINAWNRGFYNALQAFDRGEMKAISDSVWAGCAKTRRV
jgi:ABC-type uncharacterized transport system fused permease/ATPase subunit